MAAASSCAFHPTSSTSTEPIRASCSVPARQRRFTWDRSSAPLSLTIAGRYRHHQQFQGDLMNKSELIEIAAKEADISKVAAGKTVDALIEAVTNAVAKGDTVTLVGFGTFKPAKRAARTGKNPQTGAVIKIAATTVPKFSAGTGFKAAVAGKKAA